MRGELLALLLLLAACGSPPLHPVATDRLTNGGFEDGTGGWGTGYIEDSIRKYHGENESLLPFVKMPKVDAVGGITLDAHSGKAAYWITNYTRVGPNLFATLSQVVAVEPGAVYGVRLWTKALKTPPGLWYITTEREWEPHTLLPSEPTWTLAEHRFITSNTTKSVEVRIVVQGPGTFGIDDVRLVRYTR